MTGVNSYLMEVEVNYRRQSYLNKAVVDRLAWEAGIDRRGPVHKMAGYALRGLENLLAASGRRPQAPALPQTIPSPEVVVAWPRDSR
jgi:hypothetical protein